MGNKRARAQPCGHNGFGLRGAARHDDHRLRGDLPGVTALCRRSVKLTLQFAPHTPQLWEHRVR
jgi:hypothetical protein